MQSSITFKVGAVLVVLSSIITGLLHVGVLYFFGLPIFTLIIGLICVWVSSASSRKKVATTAIPFIVIPVIFFTLMELNRADPEIYLIPADFRGQFYLVLNEPCGMPLESEKGARVYRIPPDGIVITRSPFNAGVQNKQFFLVDASGNRSALPQFSYSTFEEEKDRWFGKTSSLSPMTVGIFYGYSQRESFIVADFLSINEYRRENQQAGERGKDLEGKLQKCRTDGRVHRRPAHPKQTSS